MSDCLVVHSFAKVNYTLDVLSRRQDGFHNLSSVFQTISLCDTLTLTRIATPGVTIECDAPGVPCDETNLASRAAAAALHAAGSDVGVHIRLDKCIPSQAGLGGGSSNAAAALRGVNALCKLNLSSKVFLHLAAGLGSDVPFFLVGGAASARGRGEELNPLPDAPEIWFVVVKPTVGVSTAKAYGAMDAMTDRVSARATRRMEEALLHKDVAAILSRMSNDFEQVVFEQYLEIALLADDLSMARARTARLCGSGASVFGTALSKVEAEEIARLVRLKYTDVHVCRSLSRDESLAFDSKEAAS